MKISLRRRPPELALGRNLGQDRELGEKKATVGAVAISRSSTRAAPSTSASEGGLVKHAPNHRATRGPQGRYSLWNSERPSSYSRDLARPPFATDIANIRPFWGDSLLDLGGLALASPSIFRGFFGQGVAAPGCRRLIVNPSRKYRAEASSR
jgi:hypothetical protein